MILIIDLCTGEVEKIKPSRSIDPYPAKPNNANIPFAEPALMPVSSEVEDSFHPSLIKSKDYS